ncbi:S-adenosyl-L-methionine-dependent methyltransferase [Aspergillus ambiguus]|uniref:S-adenosyl-L-methionine-dependent methyltransferase n=1 Tax=Aspergillus ambiguus TaxID=176160 RepID=UPI003CCCAFAD
MIKGKSEPMQGLTLPKGKLISHFEERSINDYASGWSALWDSGNSDLWDRGKPSPALIDTVEEHRQHPDDLFYPFSANGGRKKALVPGCGRGYDVVMLALHGFDAYGLEISSTAVKEAQDYALMELKTPQGHNFGDSYPPTDNISGGTATFLEGDFFQSDWCKDTVFDIIYDYTFLCALHPSMRRNWAARMASLLRTGGVLVCLEFPMYKDPSLPGPPWGINGVHWDLLSQGGDGMITGKTGHSKHDSQGLFIRKLYIRPRRTYEMGKGTDMLSIYARK